MDEVPGLGAFLAALRADGFAIGARELAWLRRVFAGGITLDRGRLRALLRCTLARDARERARFDTLFENWWGEAESRLPALSRRGAAERPAVEEMPASPGPGIVAEPRVETPPAPESIEEETALEASRPRFWRIPEFQWFVLLVALTANLALWYPQVFPPTAKIENPEEIRPATGAETPVQPPPPEGLPTEPSPVFWSWVPTPRIVAAPMDLRWLVGLAALALAVLAVVRYRRRWRLPRRRPLPPGGPAWLPPRVAAGAPVELLAPGDLRRMVWNVGRFVGEETSRLLDLPRSVAATARHGGYPVLYRRPEIRLREVWLWWDELTRDPQLPRLLAEVERTLRRAGLPVRVGRFTGVPEQVVWNNGEVFNPLVAEGSREGLILAILTDGQGMAIARDSALDGPYLENLLRGLALWPRVALVDFGRGRHGLAGLARGFGIDCIAPEGLPASLGGREARPVAGRAAPLPLVDDLRGWAAACALSVDGVDEATALALRRALGLELSPWRYRDLLANGRMVGAGLRFEGGKRVELLNWLGRVSPVPSSSPPFSKGGQGGFSSGDGATVRNPPQPPFKKGGSEEGGDLLHRALDFWLERLRHDRRQRRAEESQQHTLTRWSATPAAERLDLEEAMLHLWRWPDRAARLLGQLYRGSRRDEIRERLRDLAAMDMRGGDVDPARVYLPWHWADLEPLSRYRLATMGFAEDLLRTGVSSTGALVAGVCAGLGAVALVVWGVGALWSPVPVVRPGAEIHANSLFQARTLRSVVAQGGGYEVRLGTPRLLAGVQVPAQAEVVVDWTWEELDNVVTLADGVELWRAGTLPAPIRGCGEDWPRRSLVVLAWPATDTGARQLAIRLLDRGSADAVLLGEDWRGHLAELAPGGGDAADQLLVVTAPGAAVPAVDFDGTLAVVAVENPGALAAQGFGFDGDEPLTDVWVGALATPVELLAGDGEAVRVRGGPAEEPGPRGIEFVEVCGGTFTMGWNESQWDDEKPEHPVMLDTFWIARTETTEAQYDPDSGDSSLPRVIIDWNDSRDFCQGLSGQDQEYIYDLPTEAQWEYAARAGTTTQYSFGDDDALLDDYAWHPGNARQAQPVGQKLPNPLGLHDMHGNVYEWNRDWYGNYPENFVIEPPGPDDGTSRLLRGGSFLDDRGGVLRSSVRNWFRPEDRLQVFGFRCVRAPRRQPLTP